LGRGYTTERDFDELKSFLPIIDGNGFNISDSYLERLTMSYKSVLEEVLNKQDILENNKEFSTEFFVIGDGVAISKRN